MTCFGRCLTHLGVVALFCVGSSAFSQSLPVEIPEGSRHFVVLVDSTVGMVTASHQSDKPDAKRRALIAAKHALADWLYKAGPGSSLPWYRPGKDRISVVQFGFGTGTSLESAEEKLGNAQLQLDYARRIIRAEAKVSRRRFLAALAPKIRTQLSILPWALPIGLSVAVPPKTPVQETLVIFLTDQGIQNLSLSSHDSQIDEKLSKVAHARLNSLRNLISTSVHDFSPAPVRTQTFGVAPDSVALAQFKFVPMTTSGAAAIFFRDRPLENLAIQSRRAGIVATFDSQRELTASHAKLELRSGSETSSKEIVLGEHNRVELAGLDGLRAEAILHVTGIASNPILGKQEFQVSFRQAVLLPAGSRVRSILIGLGFVAILIFLGMWVYVQAVLARHFQLWLPGYVSSFRLPALAQRVASRHIVRVPLEVGDLAAVLILPPRLIRLLFYRNAELHWDSKLRIPVLPAETLSAKLNALPTITKFICQERPPNSGEFDLTIERSFANGRNQKARINVRFLSLPNRMRSPLETP